jgi:Ca2+-binding RTX toxin-like protein
MANLFGNSLNNTISGADAADYIDGGGGNDNLMGNGSNNSLDGGGGADVMLGGAGDDIYVVDNVGDKVHETTLTNNTINAGGTDTISSSVTYTLGNYVEILNLTGTANINGTGNTLNNTLIGNAYNNSLNGGLGNDSINGGAGNDTLIGGAGNDSLDGGTGADYFLFNTSLNGLNNVDLINGFEKGIDKMQLSKSIFGQLITARLSTQINIVGTTQDTNDYLIYNGSNGYLYYDQDANGSKSAIQFATVQLGAGQHLSSSDFVIV